MQKKQINYGYLEGWLSVLINTILFGLKLWVGILSGSVAMIADAWHTLSDTLTSFVVIFGFWIAKKPADKRHPFGHGRTEWVSALVIATLLAMVGFKFILDSIEQLCNYQVVEFHLTAVLIFGLSLLVKEALARFAFWAGKKIDSRSLVADGWHHRSDAVASGLIIVGALLGKYIWWIDGILGLIVSILILKAAFDIFKDTVNLMLGEPVDEELEQQITAAVRRVIGRSDGLHHFHLHRYGAHREVSFHLRFPGDMVLMEIHQRIQLIEAALCKELGIEATIHIDPK